MLDPRKMSLGTLLTDQPSLEVPDYQRPYSWEREHVGGLYQDLRAVTALHAGTADPRAN